MVVGGKLETIREVVETMWSIKQSASFPECGRLVTVAEKFLEMEEKRSHLAQLDREKPEMFEL